MKRLSMLSALFVAAAALLVAPATKASAASPDDKVVICHVNTDDPDEPALITITVAASAVPAHLAHGDTLGACPVQ